MEHFFTELEERLETARRESRDRCHRFFDDLKPRLVAARKLERELNRHLAHRFDVFKYLRTNEFGLSRIIADLLDSRASHGQGATFFRTFLKSLEEQSGWPSGIKIDESSLSVCTEFNTTGNRRIDIAVRFKDTQGTPHCIAIENKPYADDQDNQIRDYLHFLNEKYEGRFILIYSPPSSQGPSSKSIDKFELDDKWTKHFRILPYCQATEDPRDGFEGYRIRDYSLEDWFADCRRNCDVERLRWFLRDAESFCQKNFGGHAMATDTDTRTIQEYVFSNADHVATAKAVHDAWPAIKERTFERFLEQLSETINRQMTDKHANFGNNIQLKSKCKLQRGRGSGLWLFRGDWAEIQNGSSGSVRRTAIRLNIIGTEPHEVWWGVESPHWTQGNADATYEPRFRMHEDLADRLGSAITEDFYPWWKYASEEFRRWGDLVPEFHQECEDKGGKFTDYFVSRLLNIAANAIPIIDKVEGTET